MNAPVTSVSLLKVLGDDAQSPRWTEFARKYADMIDGYLFRYFPTVDAADVVNETLATLVQQLPLYQYDPDTKGHFRNFLIGIVRYKAIAQIKARKRETDLREAYAEKQARIDWEYNQKRYVADLSDWQREAYEAALAQFMADPSLPARDREIFHRVALQAEKPDEVAALFGMSRNNVDQIKSRMLAKLKALALLYANVCG